MLLLGGAEDNVLDYARGVRGRNRDRGSGLKGGIGIWGWGHRVSGSGSSLFGMGVRAGFGIGVGIEVGVGVRDQTAQAYCLASWLGRVPRARELAALYSHRQRAGRFTTEDRSCHEVEWSENPPHKIFSLHSVPCGHERSSVDSHTSLLYTPRPVASHPGGGGGSELGYRWNTGADTGFPERGGG